MFKCFRHIEEFFDVVFFFIVTGFITFCIPCRYNHMYLLWREVQLIRGNNLQQFLFCQTCLTYQRIWCHNENIDNVMICYVLSFFFFFLQQTGKHCRNQNHLQKKNSMIILASPKAQKSNGCHKGKWRWIKISRCLLRISITSTVSYQTKISRASFFWTTLTLRHNYLDKSRCSNFYSNLVPVSTIYFFIHQETIKYF